MRFIEIPALITEDIEDPSIVDITEPITVSISGTTMTIDGGSKVSGEASVTLTGDVTVNAFTLQNVKQPSIHKISVKTNRKGNFTYVPNDTVTASSVSTTTKTGSDFEILLITTTGGETYVDFDMADYVSPALYTSNALTGFDISELTSTYGATAKLYKPDGTLLTTVTSATTGGGVNFGYTESTPQDVTYTLEVEDDLGRTSRYDLPRKWISYAMSSPGFEKLALAGNEYTSTTIVPNLTSTSKVRVHKTGNHGYLGINFKIQGRNTTNGAWVDIDDTGENENDDESKEFLAFGDYLYHRVWVKPTAKATTTVSSSNVVTLTLSNLTEENVTTSFTGVDPFDINESTNTYVFEETTKVGTIPFTVTLGTETYTNAVTATTEGTAYDYVTLAFANPTLSLTTSNVTISSAKLYRDDVLFHTYGTESNVVLRSDQTGTYQAIVNDVYYSNRVTPDFTTTRSVSVPQLEFDGYNRLNLSNSTPTSTTLGLPDGTTRDLTTQSNVYIYETGTYTANVQTSNTFAYLSNVVSNVVVPQIVSGSPLSIEWASLGGDYSNFDGDGGRATGTGSGVLVLNGTYDTLITSPYNGININLTGASSLDYNFRYKIPFKPKTQSFELSFTCLKDRVFQAYLGYLTLNWTISEGWNTSGDTRQKVVNVYAEPNTVYLASMNGQSLDQTGYTADYTKPFTITSDQSTLKVEWDGNSKSIDLTATHEDSSGNTVTDPEYYFWMNFSENSTSSLFDLSDITYSIDGVIQRNIPKLTFDNYNKLTLENITQTSSTLKYGSNTYDTNTASNVYVTDAGEYILEAKDANTFVISNVYVGAVDTQVDYTNLTSMYYGGAVTDVNGVLYTWGHDSYGDSGRGASDRIPTAITTISDPVSNVWRGTPGYTVAAKTSTDKWYMWGRNTYSAVLGNTTNTGNVTAPEDVTAKVTEYFGDQTVSANKIIKMAMGEHHAVALTAGGKVWSWGGDNAYYATGTGTNNNTVLVTPVLLTTDGSTQLTGITNVEAVYHGTAALDSSGNVWFWGGSNTSMQYAYPTKILEYLQPTVVNDISLTFNNYYQLVNGTWVPATKYQLNNTDTAEQYYEYNLDYTNVTSTIIRYYWGGENAGRWVDPSTDSNGHNTFGTSSASSGNSYSDQVTTANTTIYVWAQGQLHTSFVSPYYQSNDSNGIVGLRATNAGTLFAWKSDGTFYTRGRGNYGQLANGSETDQYASWQTVTTLQGKTIKKVFGGNENMFVWTDDGVYGVGRGNNYKLGNGSTSNRSTFHKSNTISALSIRDIDFGHATGIVITTDGRGYMWGEDSSNSMANALNGNQSGAAEATSISALTFSLPLIPTLTFDGYNKLSIDNVDTGGEIPISGSSWSGRKYVLVPSLNTSDRRFYKLVLSDGSVTGAGGSGLVIIYETDGTYTVGVNETTPSDDTYDSQYHPHWVAKSDITSQVTSPTSHGSVTNVTSSDTLHGGYYNEDQNTPYKRFELSIPSSELQFGSPSSYTIKKDGAAFATTTSNTVYIRDTGTYTAEVKGSDAYAIELSKEVTGTVSQHPTDVVPSLTYDNYNKITLENMNYEDTATVTDPNESIHEIGTAKTMYVKDTGEYVFKISGTDKYVESNVYVSSVDLVGAPTKPIDFDGYNKLTLIDAGSNVSANVTYFSNTYELGSANVLYINRAGTYDLEMSGSNVFALSSNVVGTVSQQHPTDVVPSLTFDNYNKLTLENFTTTDIEWPPASFTSPSVSDGNPASINGITSTNSAKDAEWVILGADYGNGTYKASTNIAVHETNAVHGPFQMFNKVNGGHDTKTTTTNTSGEWTIELPSSIVLYKYSLHHGNNVSTSANYPKDWTIEGSNDGTTWVVLDTRSNETYTSSVTGHDESKREYSIVNNTTKYKHYKLNVSAINSGSYILIGAWKLFEKKTRTATLTDPNGNTYSLGQTQNDIYIEDTGEYILEVTNSDQSAVVKTNVGTISKPSQGATPSGSHWYNNVLQSGLQVTIDLTGYWSNWGIKYMYELTGNGSNGYTDGVLVFRRTTNGSTYNDDGDNRIGFNPFNSDGSRWHDIGNGEPTSVSKNTSTGQVTLNTYGSNTYFYDPHTHNSDGSTGGDPYVLIYYPELTFDTYNKLSIENITPTSTRLTYGSNTYEIGTASNVYIEDAGTYKVATGDATTFALVSNVVGTTPTQLLEWSDTSQSVDALDTVSGDKFGISVGMDGNYAIVGAQQGDGGNGSAYIFYKSGVTWTEQAKLTASDKASNDVFGDDVDISGDYAIVASRQDDDPSNAGSVYIFKREGTTWTQKDRLRSDSPGQDDNFGDSVAISGDYAAVCSAYDDDANTNSGAIFVFNRNSDETWSRQIKLTPVSDSSAAIGEEGALNINGDYLAFGYKRYNSNRGRVYVYKRSGTSWGDVAYIDNPSDQTNSYFGQKSIAMAGDYLAAGSTNISVDGITEAGAVYVFKRGTYSLNQVGHAIPDEHTAYYGPSDWICQSVSGTVGIYKHIYRTGIPVDSGLNTLQYDSSTSTWSDHGAHQPVYLSKNSASNSNTTSVSGVTAGDIIRGWNAYDAQRGQFTHPSGSTTMWVLKASLSASDKSANAHFGSSMRMTTDTLVIGAQSVNSSQGQVYIFERTGEDWTEVKIITASDAASNHYFGHVADISGTDIIVGAYGNNKSYFFDKAYRGPELTYDTSNKLSIENLTPTSTTLTDPNGSSFDIGTATDVYIRDSGTYSIASKDANTFVLASNTVTGTPTGTYDKRIPLAFHHGTFADSGDPYGDGLVTIAATNGHVYSDTPTGTYSWGTLSSTTLTVGTPDLEPTSGSPGDPGNTTYTWTPPSVITNGRTLVVAGGGGGGNDMGGGGGAGGLLASSSTNIAKTEHTIVVGGGGTRGYRGSGGQIKGGNGGNSSISGPGITAIGGGGGGSSNENSGYANGVSGGSGGGGSGYGQSSGGTAGGAGTSGQGHAGASRDGNHYPGGGGGAGTAGSSNPGHGGDGVEDDILGTSYWWAGGGGGAGHSGSGGNGGKGGGGGGVAYNTTDTSLLGTNDTNGLTTGILPTITAGYSNDRGGSGGKHTGGGGGGGEHNSGENSRGGRGGSGIVVIQVPTTETTPSQVYDTTKTITVSNVPSTLTDVVGKIYKGSTAYTIHATTSSSNVIIENTGTYVSVFTTATQAFLTNAIDATQPTTTSDDTTIEDEATTTSVSATVAFHHGTFSDSEDPHGDGSITAAAIAGHVYSDTAPGTYTWGTLTSGEITAMTDNLYSNEDFGYNNGTPPTSGFTTYKWTPPGTIINGRTLVVAGGGGGGTDSGGGGGAGGLLASTTTYIAHTEQTIQVGDGGARGYGPGSSNDHGGGDGGDSFISGPGIIAFGGGGGGTAHTSNGKEFGRNGGSGGGTSGYYQNVGNHGPAGLATPGQGHDGGLVISYNNGAGGGGGGGASTAGSVHPGHGGDGIEDDILGTSYWWAGGGGGATMNSSLTSGNGGKGGGGGGTGFNGGTPGANDTYGITTGTAPTETASYGNDNGGSGGKHTGGGGGGGEHNNQTDVLLMRGGRGGSGIVVIKFTTVPGIAGSTAVPTETTTDAPSVTLDATDTTVTDPTLDLDFTTTLPRTLKRYNNITSSSIGARFNRRETRKKRIEKSISIPTRFSAELTANNASSPTTLTVTVANSKFVINGDETPTLGFIRGETYTFDQSDASNDGHPLVLATSEDGATQYTTGWTASGTPGTDGSHAFIVPYDVPDTIYYKCTNHPNMGGEINTTFGNAFSLGDFTVAANTHVSGEYTLAVNYDGTTSNLYVNGFLITQTTPTISAGIKEFILGKEFDGYVKNFKFWNRILVPKGIPYLSQIGSMSSGSWYDEGTTHLAPNIIDGVAQTSGEDWTDSNGVTHTIWGFDLKAGLTGAQQPHADGNSWITFKPGTTALNGTWYWGLPSGTAQSRSGNTISIYEGSSLRGQFTDTNMFVDGMIPITPNPKSMNNDI